MLNNDRAHNCRHYNTRTRLKLNCYLKIIFNIYVLQMITVHCHRDFTTFAEQRLYKKNNKYTAIIFMIHCIVKMYFFLIK